MSRQLFYRAPFVAAMGVYANYDAVPLDIVEAYRSDFDGLTELCEAEASPCWPFSIHKAWRVVWCALEPDAFFATAHPEDAPPQPAGPLGAAVVGAEPLNVAHSRERGEGLSVALYHTRWSDPAGVERSAEALRAVRAVRLEDVEGAYASGAVARAFRYALPLDPTETWRAIERLADF